MILDTHEAVEKMVEAGASKKMAEAIVKTINTSSDHLATKEDIRALKSDLFQVKTELKGEIAQVKTELGWIKAMLFAVLGLLIAPMVAQFIALYLK
ncbi:DUF1640 domain-containing protein [Candidatus Megaera venefica]|uniref:DUF1640 domain-containing protein n=1 Tax=Candidatus Megaera venefica TaxID=2055910 RepID=A0ABU5NB19_9RICK|nr:hypothetical protein [Candidatus Megaera venefica]MEA0970370.1 DUF1640 domain-containing protein [Candidatus Megaera venefica]